MLTGGRGGSANGSTFAVFIRGVANRLTKQGQPHRAPEMSEGPRDELKATVMLCVSEDFKVYVK